MKKQKQTQKQTQEKLDGLWARYMRAEREAMDADNRTMDEAETECAKAYRAWWEAKRAQEREEDTQRGIKSSGTRYAGARTKRKLFGAR